MLQALEVLRRRIDDPQTGIPESVITRQGGDRILIEIPGVDRVPDIFRKTGFLEFKIVQDAAPSEELLRAKHKDGLPPGTEIAVEKERKTDRVITAYLVPVDADINGDFLTDAQVQFDNRVNEWQVSFTWSAEGGQIFGELTEKTIGQPLAIILDDQVYSAPVIRDRISRQGQISGRFSSEEARDLAVVLRAGALPIPVKIEEERTIGPALGHDSIRRGIWASVVSFVLVVALTILYYRLSGVYASLALIVNMISLVGLMALFEGTLTMPGIAGLVLTVGMAVDANVIIFERIREELRAGRTPRAAIAGGLPEGRAHHPRRERHEHDHGGRAVRVRHRPDQGLRRHALRRDPDQRVRGARGHPDPLRDLPGQPVRHRSLGLGAKRALRAGPARNEVRLHRQVEDLRGDLGGDDRDRPDRSLEAGLHGSVSTSPAAPRCRCASPKRRRSRRARICRRRFAR